MASCSRQKNTDTQDTRHGRDVQTEQTTTDACEGSYEVLRPGQTVA